MKKKKIEGNRRYSQYLKILIILLISSAVTISCSKGTGNVREIQINNEERVPTFLNIEEIYSVEGGTLAAIERRDEVTWFDTYGSCGHEFWQSGIIGELITGEFEVEIPEYVDIIPNSESFIAISIGRRIESLYYFEDSRRLTADGLIIASPIFEREYHSGTVFLYRVNPLPVSGFTCNLFFSGFFTQMISFNNIPFDVWESPASVKFEHANPIHAQVEINVKDAYLRSYPTRNSRIMTRLEDGDRTLILAYVEEGEEIEGNSRWYFVEWNWFENYTKEGFIHSSFISY